MRHQKYLALIPLPVGTFQNTSALKFIKQWDEILGKLLLKFFGNTVKLPEDSVWKIALKLCSAVPPAACWILILYIQLRPITAQRARILHTHIPNTHVSITPHACLEVQSSREPAKLQITNE